VSPPDPPTAQEIQNAQTEVTQAEKALQDVTRDLQKAEDDPSWGHVHGTNVFELRDKKRAVTQRLERARSHLHALQEAAAKATAPESGSTVQISPMTTEPVAEPVFPVPPIIPEESLPRNEEGVVDWDDDGPIVWTEDGRVLGPLGWTTRGCAVWVAAILGVSLAVAGVLIGLALSGGSPIRRGTSTTRHRIVVPLKIVYPDNTVYDGAFSVVPKGSTSTIYVSFTVANPEPGDYTATWTQTPNGVLSGSGTAADNTSNPITIPVTASSFGDFGQLKITAPDGREVGLGPLNGHLPFVLNSSSDVASGFSAFSLKTPLPGRPASRTQVAAITKFSTSLFHDLSTGNVSEELTWLNSDVINLYGTSQCQTWLGTLTDPTAAITVKGVNGPSSYDYTSGGLTTRVSDTFFVDATLVLHGHTLDQVVHVAEDHSGKFSWFTNCGTPLKTSKR